MAEKLRKISVKKRFTPSEGQAGRTIKMLQPICDECQQGLYAQDWYKSCPHEPYTSTSEVPHRETQTKTIDGKKIVTGVETTLVMEESDNVAQVTLAPGHDSGKGVQMALAAGFVFPEDRGVAPYCQYRECWSQDLKVHSAQFGNYCSDNHARLAIANLLEVPLEVLDGNRRYKQLMQISL